MMRVFGINNYGATLNKLEKAEGKDSQTLHGRGLEVNHIAGEGALKQQGCVS